MYIIRKRNVDPLVVDTRSLDGSSWNCKQCGGKKFSFRQISSAPFQSDSYEAVSLSRKLLSADRNVQTHNNIKLNLRQTYGVAWPAVVGLTSICLMVITLVSCTFCKKHKKETLVGPLSKQSVNQEPKDAQSKDLESKPENKTITVDNTVSVTIGETSPINATPIKSMKGELIEVESVKSIEIKSVTSIERVKVTNNESKESEMVVPRVALVERTLDDVQKKPDGPAEVTLEDRLKRLLKDDEDDEQDGDRMGSLPGQPLGGGNRRLSQPPGASGGLGGPLGGGPMGRRGTRKMSIMAGGAFPSFQNA